ncbi:hypothetical protein EJ08DRAFT_683307 [Tothia fuscella]|uniref:Uncharacterized protein n=1 Tax=Tothia fuscella TaxID=1048955 RepID=A0A9P4NGQ1_9PEZI|nr:hypothetical protein EJ08DRAFT_683307 [Tothia fuscella]
MSSSTIDLPDELWFLVAEQFDLQNPIDETTVLNIRLTSSKFRDCGAKSFERLFNEITVHLHPRSLSRVKEISSHATLRTAVQKIFLSQLCIISPQELLWYSPTKANDPIVDKHRTLYEEQLNMWTFSQIGSRDSRAVSSLLAEALRPFKNCHTVGLNDRPGLFPNKKIDVHECFLYDGSPENEGFPSQEHYEPGMFFVLTQAVAIAGLAVTELRNSYDHHHDQILVNTQLPRTIVGQAFGQVNKLHLEMSVMTKSTFLRTFINNMHNLESFSFAILPQFETRAKNLERTLPIIRLSKLRQFSLKDLGIAFPPLEDFLTRHSESLREVKLLGVGILDPEQWKEVLKTLGHNKLLEKVAVEARVYQEYYDSEYTPACQVEVHWDGPKVMTGDVHTQLDHAITTFRIVRQEQ